MSNRKELFNKIKEDPAKYLPDDPNAEFLSHSISCPCTLCEDYWNGVAQEEQGRRTIDDNNYVDDPSHSPQEKE